MGLLGASARRNRAGWLGAATASWLLGMGLAWPAGADPEVDRAYRELGRRHTAHDLRGVERPGPELRFLEALFAHIDEGVVLTAGVVRWLGSDGARGLHFEDYREAMGALRARIRSLEVPEKAGPARDRIVRALGLQLRYFADWNAAREAGRAFDSQLHSEFGFHEALHRARRQLVQAYAELHALHPEGHAGLHRAVHEHLRGLYL